MPKSYIGLTIGPIYKTLKAARSTKELWAASYLFSLLMRKLLEKIPEKQVILPHPGKVNEPLYKNYGAGIFPDRLIMEAKTGDFDKMQEYVAEVLDDIAGEIQKLYVRIVQQNRNGVLSSKDFYDFVKNYFQIYFVQKELESIDKGQIIYTLSPHLDTLELQSQFVAEENVRFFKKQKKTHQNYLETFISRIHLTKLYQQVFSAQEPGTFEYLREVYQEIDKLEDKRGNNVAGFPSIQDIATVELYQRAALESENARIAFVKLIAEAYLKEKEEKNFRQKQDRFYEALENFYDKSEQRLLQHYHRYYCIVYADGDGIGNTIKTLKDKNTYLGFSKKLADFAETAATRINNFGGKPVYIGGDDLMFFAPVRSHHGTIFDLLVQLDDAFHKLNFSGSPTLSYGIAITYHKFPLFEALAIAQKMLFDQAKKIADSKTGNKLKNAVAFRVLTHSGSYYGSVLHKNYPSYTLFRELLQLAVGTDNFFNSMTYKLREGKALLKQLYDKNDIDNTRRRFGFYFDNYFNEPIHQGEKGRQYLALLKILFPQVYLDYGIYKAPDVLFSLLRTLNFLTPKKTGKYESAGIS